MKQRTIGGIGYIERPVFNFDWEVDRRQVESMLAARQDDFLIVHWDDLDLSLSTQKAYDLRRECWTAADYSKCDALLILEAPAPGSPFADFHHAEATMAPLLARGIPAVNSLRTFLEYPDKRYIIDRSDLPFPRTRLVTTESDLGRAIEGLGDPVVLKPLIGAGGDGVGRVAANADALRQAMKPGHEYLLQEFLPEIVDGERCLFFFAKKYRYAVIKRPLAGEFVTDEAHAKFERYEPTAAELALACDAIERFGSPSLIERVDIVGSKVMEMTFECPGLSIQCCGVEREVGYWTYEAIDMAIAAGGATVT